MNPLPPYTNIFYHKYKRNVYFQNGEDGIIEELLRRLAVTDGWVCEFGAWDGIHLSNTFRLVERGFKAVFIEGDIARYKDLLKTAEAYPQIVPVNCFVAHLTNDNDNLLDNILSTTTIPTDFEVLSIDIDSFDYQVWRSVTKYRPKIVIIEINSSVSTNNTAHIHEPGRYEGTGFRPMFDLGRVKGYTFVLHTGNMIFIRDDLFYKLDITYKNELENFNTYFGGH